MLENSHAVLNDTGELLYYEGTLTEITERKRTEEALSESEKRYHTLIETLQDGLSLFDLNGNMQYFNQRKKDMLGYENDEDFMKVNTFSMIHQDDKHILNEVNRELVKHGYIRNKELRALRKDGSWFWADGNLFKISKRRHPPEEKN